MDSQNQEINLDQKIFDNLMDIFITPEVVRRQNAGELEKPLDLRAAQIVFYPDGRKNEVRINSEVKAEARMKLKPGTSKHAGDLVYEHELEGLEKISLSEDDDPDCAHVTFIRFGDKWAGSFDFRYNKALSRQHIERANEFCDAAEFSLNQKNFAAFVDTLFSAIELVAKALLLSLPDAKFRKKAEHADIKKKFYWFADLGNVQPAYRDTFDRLLRLRYPARYLQGNLALSVEEAHKLLESVKGLLRETSSRIDIVSNQED